MSGEWVDDKYCFACGDKNPIGMRLHFTLTKDGGLEAKYTFPKELQGYSGIVHGGMISLLLDEVMVNLPWLKLKQPVVSADIRIKLKKPLKIGVPVIARAFITRQKKNIFWVKSALIREADGVEVAQAEATCVQVSLEQMNG